MILEIVITCMKHCLVLVSSPSQPRSPGLPLTHDLVLICTPESHVWLHPDHKVHGERNGQSLK